MIKLAADENFNNDIVRGLQEDKLPVPKSHSFAEYVAVM